MNDLKFAFRQVLKNPGFTAVTVLTLGLGIGTNTAVFGVLDRLMIRSLPVPAPHELARVGMRDERNMTYYSFDYPLYAHYRDHSAAFSGVAAYSAMSVSLTAGGEAERVP